MNKEIKQSYDLLKKVYFDNAYAGIELNKLILENKYNANTNLITKIVYGVLEKDIYLDYLLSQFIKNKTDEQIFLLLKIGAYIIKEINSIPNFACVNEIVEMSKKIKGKFIGGFVNATLKNIINKNISLPNKTENPIKYLSVTYSYPEWLVKILLKDNDYNFVEDMLKYSLTTLTHIRILTDKINVKEFLNVLKLKNISYSQSALDYTLYVEYSKLLSCKELNNKYVVQGLPSIITALNMGITPNSRVLDICAAPGGKSVLMAQLQPTATIISCDKAEHRLCLIKNYSKKYNVTNIEVKKNDATILREEWKEKFDFVLCDVPCSNLGIANKKPDILLNKKSENIKELTELQYKILENASQYLKKDGTIIYSTCTILKEENQLVIKRFLQNNSNFALQPLNTYGVEVLKEDNMCTFYPHIGNTEGFFIGRLKKI